MPISLCHDVIRLALEAAIDEMQEYEVQECDVHSRVVHER
jgi:hypothetical protein